MNFIQLITDTSVLMIKLFNMKLVSCETWVPDTIFAMYSNLFIYYKQSGGCKEYNFVPNTYTYIFKYK